MGLRDMYSAGDIIEYEGGGRDYLVSIEGEEGLWVNACNPSWATSARAPSRMPADGTGRTRPCIAAECATMVGPSPFLTVVACGDRGMFDALGPLV